jgi:5-methylthioribose kinase
VLKQSQERLRVAMEWRSRLDRIWIERDALALLSNRLPPGAVPQVLFDDLQNYLFAMTAAPADARVWKEELLLGRVDLAIGKTCGRLLAAMHDISEPEVLVRFADQTVFDELRLDPYYRTIARVHPVTAPILNRMIDESGHSTTSPRFVHADFSPKNMLISNKQIMIVDFETAHAGDPSFDLGFFASHVMLKAYRAAPDGHEPYLALLRAFVDSYCGASQASSPRLLARFAAATRHKLACLLARVDGKSPVEYLDPARQDRVRRFALTYLAHPFVSWEKLLWRLEHEELRGEGP